MLREAGPATNTDTVLAVDFGSANTRALLFDVVGSVYRFVGYGEAPSTINAPYRDASEACATRWICSRPPPAGASWTTARS